jgi:hypothetical protein
MSNYVTLENAVFFRQEFSTLVKQYPVIDFSYNWNNKLYCDVFPTYRIENPSKYKPGKIVVIQCKGQIMGVCEIISVKPLQPEKVTDEVAYLDTGYDRAEFLKLIHSMYKDKVSKSKFVWIFCRWIEFFPQMLRWQTEKAKNENFKPSRHDKRNP